MARSQSNVLAALYITASVLLSLHYFQGMLSNIILSIVLLCVIISNLSQTRTPLLTHDWMYLAYFCFAIVSALWSVAPEETILQALPLIVPWFAAFLLAGSKEASVCRFIIQLAVLVAILSIVMPFVDRGLAYQPFSSSGAPELRGIFAHQLFLGSFLTIALGLAAIAYLNGELRAVVGRSTLAVVCVIGLLAFVLFLSRTRLYVAAGVLSLAVTWLLSRSGSRRWISVNLMAIGAIITALSASAIVSYLESLNFDLTLTGRTDVWERTLSAVEGQTNLWGFGLGSFQLPMFDYLFGNFRPSHANNSFIQAYFELGALGLGLLIILVLSQLISAWQYAVRSDRYSYSLFLVLFSVFGSLTGGGIYAGFLTTTLCLMLLMLSIETHRTGNAGTIVSPSLSEKRVRRIDNRKLERRSRQLSHRRSAT